MRLLGSVFSGRERRLDPPKLADPSLDEDSQDILGSPLFVRAMKPLRGQPCVRFGLFELNLQTRELRKQGVKVKLGQHAFRILALLLEHPGQIRTREEIRQQLWGTDTFVNFDPSLNKAIHQLREAMGDPCGNPHYIETVAGRGYRFIYFEQNSQQASRKPKRKLRSVAVLPFATEPVTPEMDLLSKRIVEKVIDTISQMPKLRVLAYSTVQLHREREADPCTLGQDLLVQAVALGEIIHPDDELLLHVELIDTDDGTQLWGVQFREGYADVCACPEKVADRICDQLRPILTRRIGSGREKRSRNAA